MCVVWFCIGVNRVELAMFLSVSHHLVCSFLKSVLREGLDLNGTNQFLVHNYYVNLMSGTIFGRVKSSRMLRHIKGYECFDVLKWHNGSIFTVMHCKYNSSERISDLTNLLQSVSSSISRRNVILIFTDVRISDLI
jgi:hypothetical protein